MSGLAAAATGVVVSGGVVAGGSPAILPSTLAEDLPDRVDSKDLAAAIAARQSNQEVSRSDRRSATDPEKEAALSTGDSPAAVHTEDVSDDDPRAIAKALMPQFGFDVAEQFDCLDALYMSESGWRVDADNPTSTAYGIPQALTGLHDLPDGYMTSAEVQIRWGLGYIQDVYSTPCGAWSFKRSHGWY